MISRDLQGIPYQEQAHPKRGDKDSKNVLQPTPESNHHSGEQQEPEDILDVTSLQPMEIQPIGQTGFVLLTNIWGWRGYTRRGQCVSL